MTRIVFENGFLDDAATNIGSRSTMTAMSSSTALTKRQSDAMALMPPPPIKRIKRPSTVLDEDDYTNALSDIIARDYFPGLAEVKAQEEYLSALESKNDAWIKEAGQNLRDMATPLRNKEKRRTSRDNRFDTPRSWNSRTPVPDTPRGNSGIGSETPKTDLDEGTDEEKEPETSKDLDTSTLSLSSFQAKYTSEDNESFNTLLDKQNNTRRKKHAYLWTPDQKIPTQRLLAHRAQETKLLKDKADHEAIAAKHEEKAIVPITTGAISSRSASVKSWTQKSPTNNLMFIPSSSVDETSLPTIAEVKESQSKAGPKETVFANTRFPPLTMFDPESTSTSIPPSPSLNTEIITSRDALRASNPHCNTPTEFTGDATPRVNGYAFVDDEDDEPPPPTHHPPSELSYRDLLAGQTNDQSLIPNPFKLSEMRRREDLHHRLVARDQARKREKERETKITTPMRKLTGLGSSSHVGSGMGGGGQTPRAESMTPAARKLMEKLGRTPVDNSGSGGQSRTSERMKAVDMWTPVRDTPRRKK